MNRKKGRRFKKAKKSGMDKDMAMYLDIEQMVKRELRDAERVYVNGILQNGKNQGTSHSGGRRRLCVRLILSASWRGQKGCENEGFYGGS